MPSPVDTLVVEAQYLRDCLRDMNTRAESRSFSPEEDADFAAGESLLAEKVALIERHNKVAAFAEIPEAREQSFTAPNVIVTRDAFDMSEISIGATPQELRSRGLAAIEQADGLTDAHREQAERLTRSLDPKEVALRIVATGSEDYRAAFGKRLKDPSGRSLTADELAAEQRAAGITGSAGGYAVPFTLDPSIILTSDGSANPFRQISRVVPITTNAWHGVSSAGVSAAFAAEATAVTDGSATLAQPTVTAHKAQATIRYSIEIDQDWVQFSSEMLTLLADAKDTLEATKFAVGAGDGSDEPFGIVTALVGTGSEINSASAESFTVADLYALEEALGPRFRSNASFVANKAWYNKVRQFDTYGGASLWERLGAGMPPQLLGYNAFEASAMDDAINAAATANNYVMVLGDFRNYVIADRVGLSVEIDPHVVDTNGKLTGQRALYAYWRVGADSVNDAAFSLLDIPTTA